MSQPGRARTRGGFAGAFVRLLFRGLSALFVACLTLGVLAAAILFAAPVDLFISSDRVSPQVRALYGTLAQGRADLIGGYTLTWDLAPGLSPWPGVKGDVEMEGADTRLSGIVFGHPFGTGFQQLEGRAGPGLTALVPGAFYCDMTASLSNVGLWWLWPKSAFAADGTITLPEGRCTRGRQSVALPALDLSLQTIGADAVATLRNQRSGMTLAEAMVAGERTLGLRIEPEAAEIFPVLPSSGQINLRYPF